MKIRRWQNTLKVRGICYTNHEARENDLQAALYRGADVTSRHVLRRATSIAQDTMVVVLCKQRSSIYALTAATVVNILTSRLGAGRAEVEWEEASYSGDNGEEDKKDTQPQNGTPSRPSKPTRQDSEYAPRGPPKPAKAYRGIIPPPLKAKLFKEGPIVGLCSACAVCGPILRERRKPFAHVSTARHQGQTFNCRKCALH